MNIDPEQIKQAIKLLRDNGSSREGEVVWASSAMDGDSEWGTIEEVGKDIWGLKNKAGEWIAFSDFEFDMPVGQQEQP